MAKTGVGVNFLEREGEVIMLAFNDPNGKHSWETITGISSGGASFTREFEYDINSIDRVVACVNEGHARLYEKHLDLLLELQSIAA